MACRLAQRALAHELRATSDASPERRSLVGALEPAVNGEQRSAGPPKRLSQSRWFSDGTVGASSDPLRRK